VFCQANTEIVERRSSRMGLEISLPEGSTSRGCLERDAGAHSGGNLRVRVLVQMTLSAKACVNLTRAFCISGGKRCTTLRYIPMAVVRHRRASVTIARGWLTASKQPVANRSLWEQLQALLDKHTVTLTWIPREHVRPLTLRLE